MKFFLTLFFILSTSFSFGQKKEIKKAIKVLESPSLYDSILQGLN